MKYEIEIVRALWPLLNTHRYTLPTIVFLGLLSSSLEGIGLYLFLPLLGMFGAGAGVAPAVSSYFDTALSFLPPLAHVPVLVLLVVLSVVGKNVVAYWNGAYFAKIDAENGHRLRSQLFGAIVSASPGHTENQPSGRLANAVLSETWRVARALGALYGLIVDACAVVIFVFILIFLSWETTLYVAPFLAAIVGIMHFVTRRARAIGEGAVAANMAYTDRSWESLSGLRTIRVFGRETYEEERHAKASSEVRRFFLEAQLLSNLTPMLFEIQVAAAFGVWIVILAWSGASVPTMAVFLMALYRMQPRVRSLVSARAELLELGSAAFEIEAVNAECRASRLPRGRYAFDTLKQQIALSHVTARYHGQDKAAIVDIDFSIPKNTTTAIVGPSGSGKSTIVNLLCRAMEPAAGRILVDNVELSDIDIGDWHSRTAVVAQDIFLFSGTVRENIRYGRLDATCEDIEHAARLAHAHDFVMELQDGYETEIGERGMRLSGGQRQRIALARALVRRPTILITDEATNALDSHSEELIQNALDQLRTAMTIISVAHRLSTVRNAHQILVVDRGRIIERGNYFELMAMNGMFATMARLQALEFNEDGVTEDGVAE